ncbi:hypothetical protein B0J18DRAFT_417651 [Chaetomium sp. MPI-SDFR-AT-0129]|nr:hypothetical protein B0J18DRAFT_417651 [Chaetomium sp. MPI-SDFR-AT-0129]
MELRPVVSVCRSVATTAARPSLAVTARPSPLPSALVLLQRRSFTPNTNNQRPAEATATATSTSPSYTTTSNSSSSPSRLSPLIPPRPPPAQAGSSNNAVRSGWANPKSALNKQRLFDNTTSPTSPLSGLGGGKTQLRGGLGLNSGLGSGSSFLDRIAKDTDRSTNPNGATGRYTMWGDTTLGRYDLAPEPSLRLRPATGRTIDLQGRVDLARGLRMLDRMVGQNGIRKMVRLARAHERPALKRKRLWRERWRSRFKEGFHAAKCRALELKRQGW